MPYASCALVNLEVQYCYSLTHSDAVQQTGTGVFRHSGFTTDQGGFSWDYRSKWPKWPKLPVRSLNRRPMTIQKTILPDCCQFQTPQIPKSPPTTIYYRNPSFLSL